MIIKKLRNTFILFLSLIISNNASANNLESLKQSIVEQENIISISSINADGSIIQSTIDSITDESRTNQYKIILGPGVYNVRSTIFLPPFIHIVGSGVDVTRIQAISLPSGQSDVIQLIWPKHCINNIK